MSLFSTLHKAVGYGMLFIISRFPNKFLYFESEQTYGSPARFILKKE